MKYAVEVASDGVIYIPVFMVFSLGIQVILRFIIS
jgi:hypothetical protein